MTHPNPCPGTCTTQGWRICRPNARPARSQGPKIAPSPSTGSYLSFGMIWGLAHVSTWHISTQPFSVRVHLSHFITSAIWSIHHCRWVPYPVYLLASLEGLRSRVFLPCKVTMDSAVFTVSWEENPNESVPGTPPIYGYCKQRTWYSQNGPNILE